MKVHETRLLKDSASSHGESSIGCWDDNPPYEIQEVLSESRAGAAIGRLQRSATSDKAAKILRANGTVRCDEYTRSRADCTTYCLFDLKADPCETTDVSRRHPEVIVSFSIPTVFTGLILLDFEGVGRVHRGVQKGSDAPTSQRDDRPAVFSGKFWRILDALARG